jgi:hypothetical protein
MCELNAEKLGLELRRTIDWDVGMGIHRPKLTISVIVFNVMPFRASRVGVQMPTRSWRGCPTSHEHAPWIHARGSG